LSSLKGKHHTTKEANVGGLSDECIMIEAVQQQAV